MLHDDTSAKGRGCEGQRAAHAPVRRRMLGIAVVLAALSAVFLGGGLGRNAIAVDASGERTARLGEGLQLLMVDDKACIWCRRWDAEVRESYRNSPLGRIAPLVRRAKFHRDLARYEPLAFTPTFLLLRDGHEIGRIVGYSGADFFWSEIERLIANAGALPQTQPDSSPDQPRDALKDGDTPTHRDGARAG